MTELPATRTARANRQRAILVSQPRTSQPRTARLHWQKCWNKFQTEGLHAVRLERGLERVDQLFVVTHPEPIRLEARPIQHGRIPEDSVALGYYHHGHILARGVVSRDALEAINGLLENPVSVALAATEDEDGNIEARVCLVLPVDPDELQRPESDEPEEPWKVSVPAPPPEVEQGYGSPPPQDGDTPKLALLPIGNVVRGARHRNHPDVVGDAREMLDNLLTGRSHDAVRQAIDDLLDSI